MANRGFYIFFVFFMCRRFFDFGGISLIFCGYKTKEVITRERFAMASVRYLPLDQQIRHIIVHTSSCNRKADVEICFPFAISLMQKSGFFACTSVKRIYPRKEQN